MTKTTDANTIAPIDTMPAGNVFVAPPPRAAVGKHVIVILVLLAVGGLLVQLLTARRQQAHTQTCINNQRQIATAVQIAVEDGDGAYPAPDRVWMVALDYMPPRIVRCPVIGDRRAISYGYNAQLSGVSRAKIAQPAALLFFADSDTPAHTLASPADLAPRHGQLPVAVFMDGHAELLAPQIKYTLKP